MINKTMRAIIDGGSMTEHESERYERAGEPMHWRDNSDARKTEIAKMFVDYQFAGDAGMEGYFNEYDEEGNTIKERDTNVVIKRALNGLTLNDAREIAADLITVNNWANYNAMDITDDMNEETIALYERLGEEYNGIDAYVYMAQEELAGNIIGDFADEKELRRIMTEELA